MSGKTFQFPSRSKITSTPQTDRDQMPEVENYESVGDSDIEDSNKEDTQPSRRRRIRHRSWFGCVRYNATNIHRSSWWFLFDGCVTLAFLWVLFDKPLPTAIKKQGNRIYSPHKLPSIDIAGDLTRFGPQFNHQVTVFSHQPQFIPNHTRAGSLGHAKGHWATLIPGKWFFMA
jgi:hypothetical protein